MAQSLRNKRAFRHVLVEPPVVIVELLVLSLDEVLCLPELELAQSLSSSSLLLLLFILDNVIRILVLVLVLVLALRFQLVYEAVGEVEEKLCGGQESDDALVELVDDVLADELALEILAHFFNGMV